MSLQVERKKGVFQSSVTMRRSRLIEYMRMESGTEMRR
jgi:hypothetical protein